MSAIYMSVMPLTHFALLPNLFWKSSRAYQQLSMAFLPPHGCPAIRGWGESLSVSSESALAAGLVMGIMIAPFVLSLSDDVINSIPILARWFLRDGSNEVRDNPKGSITNSLPGIVSALLLAVSRAVGETMIVVMAAGLAANLTINPLEAVTTVTVQIVTLLVGDQNLTWPGRWLRSPLAWYCSSLRCASISCTQVVQKYREQYD